MTTNSAFSMRVGLGAPTCNPFASASVRRGWAPPPAIRWARQRGS